MKLRMHARLIIAVTGWRRLLRLRMQANASPCATAMKCSATTMRRSRAREALPEPSEDNYIEFTPEKIAEVEKMPICLRKCERG